MKRALMVFSLVSFYASCSDELAFNGLKKNDDKSKVNPSQAEDRPKLPAGVRPFHEWCLDKSLPYPQRSTILSAMDAVKARPAYDDDVTKELCDKAETALFPKESLDLSGTPFDLLPLTSLPNLKELNFNALSIHFDRSNIEALTQIKKLSVGQVEYNGKGLEKMTNLESLVLRQHYISDITFIESLVGLKELVIIGADPLMDPPEEIPHLENVDSIAKLVDLEYLDLSNNKITDVSALKSLTKLKKLKLSKNPLPQPPQCPVQPDSICEF